MLIAGAGGHAKELIGILYDLNQMNNVFCFDDVTPAAPAKLMDIVPILKSEMEVRQLFKTHNTFTLGTGRPHIRRIMLQKIERYGGILTSIISPRARVGHLAVELGDGLNIMSGAIVNENVKIGKGTLINANATVHHDCVVGEFCELSPGCHLLGSVTLGEMVFIGAGAVILPSVRIGAHAIIGAGSVVTKDVPDGMTVKGIPAKL
jgi:sugar O-acyltransferase (sialic acid O-acetyltransferase NeuD family)